MACRASILRGTILLRLYGATLSDLELSQLLVQMQPGAVAATCYCEVCSSARLGAKSIETLGHATPD